MEVHYLHRNALSQMALLLGFPAPGIFTLLRGIGRERTEALCMLPSSPLH